MFYDPNLKEQDVSHKDIMEQFFFLKDSIM